MRQLNNGQCSTTVLKSLFLEQLPESQRAILIAINEPDLQKVAEIADKIADMDSQNMALAPIQTRTGKSKSRNLGGADTQPDIENQLAELIKRMDLLETKVTKRNRDRSPSRSRANSKHREEQKTGLCFAH